MDQLNWGVRGAARPAPRHLLDRRSAAWIVLAIMIVVTLALWHNTEQAVDERAHDRFQFLADEAKLRLVDRMEDYAQVLRGGAALFEAEAGISRAEWRTYVAALELDEYLPGVQGIGYAAVIPRASLDAHERAVRAEGFPDYAVHPPGDRDPLSSIVYIEPFTGPNLRTFGYDMYAEPVRREAMERARDTGLPTLSGRVVLVQDTGSNAAPSGFFIYLPVYRHGIRHDSVDERRAALQGFVYSPFRAADLMHSVFALPRARIDIEVFDQSAEPGNLLFASYAKPREARFVADRKLEIFGHLWIARFHSTPLFETNQASTRPLMLLLGGAALDLMLFVVLYMNANHRHRMRTAATELRKSRESFRSLVENIPGCVFRSRIGASGGVHVSSGIESLTGEPPERFLSGELSFDQLIHPEDKPAARKIIDEAIARQSAYRVEYRIRAADGHSRWVSERGKVIPGDSGRPQWLDGVILDIDDRKRAEIAIRELAFNDPLTGLANRRVLLDRLEHQLATSSRTGKYGALLFIDLDDFKAINDTLGHAIGDQLLIEVANRLRTHVRESDTVARLGGDEFIVMLDDIAEDKPEAVAWALDVGNKILAELNRPYVLGEHRLRSAASIGITLFRGHEASADQVLRRADRAMYRAKSSGRNRIAVYE